MSTTDLRSVPSELFEATTRSSTAATTAITNAIAARFNLLNSRQGANQVLPGALAGVSVDGTNAENAETDNTIYVQIKGLQYRITAITELDISALSAGGATVAQSAHGIAWVFVNAAGTGDVEVDIDAQAYTSGIAAWAGWVSATNTLPPLGAAQVAIGAIHINEGGSGAFTWGTDSLTDETELYFDFFGLPGVESVAASFAADADAATFTYGATVVRLGSGTRVSATGKANVTITGSNVATGTTGAWLVYVLADDVEFAKQLDNDYATRAAALEAIRDHNPNPMLPIIGYFTVENNSGADFIPGTTKFDKAGITSTFTKVGPGADQLEVGRAATGQAIQAVGRVLDLNGNVLD